MRYQNVPDDWGQYYTSCSSCGERYHMSEGGCDSCSECEWCNEYKSANEYGEDGEGVCDDCWCCDNCGKDTKENARYYIFNKDEEYDPKNPPEQTYTSCLVCKVKDEAEGYHFVKVDQ